MAERSVAPDLSANISNNDKCEKCKLVLIRGRGIKSQSQLTLIWKQLLLQLQYSIFPIFGCKSTVKVGNFFLKGFFTIITLAGSTTHSSGNEILIVGDILNPILCGDHFRYKTRILLVAIVLGCSVGTFEEFCKEIKGFKSIKVNLVGFSINIGIFRSFIYHEGLLLLNQVDKRLVTLV